MGGATSAALCGTECSEAETDPTHAQCVQTNAKPSQLLHCSSIYGYILTCTALFFPAVLKIQEGLAPLDGAAYRKERRGGGVGGWQTGLTSITKAFSLCPESFGFKRVFFGEGAVLCICPLQDSH